MHNSTMVGNPESSEVDIVNQEKQLKCLVDSLKESTTRRAEDEYNGLVQMRNYGNGVNVVQDCVASLIRLFQHMLLLLEKNETALRSFSGGYLHAIQELKAICNSRGRMILEIYIRHRRLLPFRLPLSGETWEEGLTLYDLRGELMELICFPEDYMEDVTFMIRPEVHAIGDCRVEFDGLEHTVHALTDCYLQLEKFLLKRDVNDAISKDTYSANVEVSSMVGDVFTIFRDFVGRAFDWSAAPSKKTLVQSFGYATQIMKEEYSEALVKRPVALNGATVFPKEIVVGLNNWDVSADHLESLIHNVQTEAQTFPLSFDIEVVVCKGLRQIVADFRQDATTGLKQLAAAIIPQLNEVLDSLVSKQYDDIAAGLQQYCALINAHTNTNADTWVQKLSQLIDTHVVPLEPLLTKRNLQELSEMLINYMADNVNSTLAKKRGAC